MTLPQLLSLIGAGFVIDPLHDKLMGAAKGQAALAPEFERMIASLLAEDPELPNRLRRLCRNHLLKDEITRSLLEFIHQACVPTARDQVQKLAGHFGVNLLNQTKAIESIGSLTDSQQAAFHEIIALSEIYFAGDLEHSGVCLRIAPLVIGPSGVGKTHVVTAVSRALNIPVLRMTVGDS